MKKFITAITIIVMFACLGLTAVGCSSCDEDDNGNGYTQFTVTFTYTGTNINIENPPSDVVLTVNAGETVPAAQIPLGATVADYDFIGWFAEDAATAFSSATVVDADIVLIARYVFATVITSVDGLRAIADNLDGAFRLGANLSLTNWTPIGTPEKPFTGILYANLDADGNPEFTVSSLTMDENDMVFGYDMHETSAIEYRYYAGLIGYNEGIVKNITIDSLDIDIIHTPAVRANAFVIVGGVVGFSRGEIINCHVLDGKIEVTVTGAARPRVGMIAGEVRGTNQPDTAVQDSSAFGELRVNGASGVSRGGGLVGTLFGGAGVFNSNAGVDVFVTTGSGNASGAGLVGHTDQGAVIRQSFASGNVRTESTSDATVYAGGLSGNTDGGNYAGFVGLTRWTFEFTDVFATGNATAVSGGNAYGSALIARIDDSGTNSSPSDILVRNAYSTGNVTVQAGGDNVFAGGITSRIQTIAGSVVHIQNSFVMGNITNETGHAASIAGRSQNQGTRTMLNLWESSSMTVVRGATNNDRVEAATNVNTTATAPSNFTSLNWQQTTLNWSSDIWTFKDGQLPTLNLISS